MQVHGSCAARDGAGVLLLGPPGAGKSDMVLRLLDRGFTLVADDRVDIADGYASPPAPLAGLLEVRGLGIVRLPYVAPVRLRLAALLGEGAGERLPAPEQHEPTGLPLLRLDPASASAAARLALALDCARGVVAQLAGAFVATETVG
jgi:HPr kinase/phosphorylase